MMLGIVLSVGSMILYIAETGIHIHLAIEALTSDLSTFIVVMSLTAGSLLLVNVISTILVLRTMDFTGRGCARTICIFLHLFQVGLLWRCLKLILLFDEKDWREFLILRLIHTALQSLPIVLFKGSHFFNGTDSSAEVIILVVISIASNAVVFSMYNTEKYLLESDEFSELSVRIRKPFGVIILTIGTVFLMFSRCGSIMLFIASAPLWLPVPLGAHYLIYFLSSTIKQFCNKKGSIKQLTKNIGISYFNVFDIFNQDNQKIACVNVLLYSGILIENVVMTGFWMFNNSWDYKYELGTVVSIILTFVCGMFLKCCSCSYLRDESFEPFSEATYQLALEIAMKKETPEILAITDSTHTVMTDIKNHEKYDNHCSVISLENGYIHKTPQVKHKHSSGSLDKTNDTSTTHSKGKKQKRGISNTDLTSSNSRNTNTLNVTDTSNVFRDIPQKDSQLNSQTMPRSSNKKRPGLTVRNSSVEAKRSFSKSPPKNRKFTVPLFPNECSNFVSTKTFESKHVLSNSADEYNDSDSSYSDDSYSYYDTSDWSSMSCYSNSDWSHSNQMIFVNLHSLPKETISATESVQFWLSQIEDIEASIDQESCHSNHICSSPVPSSEHTQSSKYVNILKETKMNDDQINASADILLRPKDAQLRFRDNQEFSYLPYSKSDYVKSRQEPNDDAIVIWHDKETVDPNSIQESMV